MMALECAMAELADALCLSVLTSPAQRYAYRLPSRSGRRLRDI